MYSKLTLIALLFCSSLPLLGMELTKYKMASKEELTKRLIAHRLFVEKTNIIERVAAKELTVLQVVVMVRQSIDEFARKYPSTSDPKDFVTAEDIKHLNDIMQLEGQKSTVTTKLLLKFPATEINKVNRLLRAKL